MKSSPVRELARRYAAGELSLDEYRAQRRNLIDAVTAGNQRIEYGQPSPRRSQPVRQRWLLLIPLVALVSAGIVISLRAVHTHGLYLPSSQTGASLVTGPSLLRGFIETNDWSDASLDQFLRHWNTLPPHEQKAARHSYLFPRLASELQEQIVSQQAMLELAPDRQLAERHLARLQLIATTLKVKQKE
ncbi:MAG: hypothetical protein WBR15_07645 [Gammaproteobacteria bacterium]